MTMFSRFLTPYRHGFMIVDNKSAIHVTRTTFASFVSDRELALLRIDQPPLGFAPRISEYFDAKYPDKISYGVIDRDSIQDLSWWTKHFGSVFGDVQAIDRVITKFYLFYQGKLTVYSHARVAETSPETAGANLVKADKELRAHVESTTALLNYFDPVIRDLLDKTKAESSTPLAAAQPAPVDPYTVLGIASSASDEEVKKAYFAKVGLNHLDAKSRQVAADETRSIVAAFEAIKGAPGRKL